MKQTPLHALHLQAGAKMVPFAGYDMPVQYKTGIIAEHLHTRAQAGLFDVSHMGQLELIGSDIVPELERCLPVDVEVMPVGRQVYTQFTADDGGLLDDLILARLADDHFMLVVNAACKEDDFNYLAERIQSAELKNRDDLALLALQGPAAVEVMQRLAPELLSLPFMSVCPLLLNSVPCIVSRSGYTGEDGFEISLPAESAERLAQHLLDYAEVEWTGLGARDSLRLEAGLCLYGHDIDTSTSIAEAGLMWSVSPSRRAGGAKAGGFPGAETLFAQIEQGVSRRRVGFSVEGRAPVREGALIVAQSGQPVGEVTSGRFGPTLGVPLAMGYIDADYASPGTALFAEVRGKQRPINVAKMPFVPHRYFRS